MRMNLIERQRDGKHHDTDEAIISLKKQEKGVFLNTYCYFIHSGYIPIQWSGFTLPKNDYINITINHKRIN